MLKQKHVPVHVLLLQLAFVYWYKMYHYSYGLFRKVAIYKCTCLCNCLSLSIYFQSDNSFPPVSIYCAYCFFIYVHFPVAPLGPLIGQ